MTLQRSQDKRDVKLSSRNEAVKLEALGKAYKSRHLKKSQIDAKTNTRILILAALGCGFSYPVATLFLK